MTYDAVLAARRGIGVEEQRLARPELVEAIHWAVFAEAQAGQLEDLRTVVATDPPDSLKGADRAQFIANRTLARSELRKLEALLYPDDDDQDEEPA